MMQVQGSNMMEVAAGGNSAAAFWGARHASWPAPSSGPAHPAQTTPSPAANPSDPKVAEKLMTELQVRYRVKGQRTLQKLK